MDAKACTLCKRTKPLDDFHRQRKGPMGRHSWCKACYNGRHPKKKQVSSERRRELNLRARYRMSPADVEALLEKQGRTCAICGTGLLRYHVDHDHDTGKVRGILCLRCNINLPFVEDAEWLRRALAYLGREAPR